MSDFLEFLSEVSIAMLCVVGIGSGLFAISGSIIFLAERASCNAQSTRMNLDHEYGLFEGCMVKLDDQWQPFPDYKTVKVK